MDMTLGEVSEKIRLVDAELQIAKHDPSKLLREVQLEGQLKDLNETYTDLVLKQQEAAAEKKEQRRKEQRLLVISEYEKADAVAAKIDAAVSNLCVLLDQFRPHVRSIVANRTHMPFVRNEADYEAHIRELLAQGGFGLSQYLGGTPPKLPLADQLKKDRQIVLGELEQA